MNLVKRWAILALAFWLTTFIVSGIQIQDGAWNYFWVAALFGVINTVLGGLLKLFTRPASTHRNDAASAGWLEGRSRSSSTALTCIC